MARWIKTNVSPRIEIELTGEEAQVLADVLGRIGGCPDTTDRGKADSIARALRDANYTCDPRAPMRGQISYE